MAEASFKVFFEPRIALHEPGLYTYAATDPGVAAAAALSEDALASWREQGFLMVRGLLADTEIRAARAELETMSRADHPGCAMIWYEGALREHLALDESRDRQVDGKRTGEGFALGQESDGLPPLDRELRARFVRKFMGFVDRQPALSGLAAHRRLAEIVSCLLGGAGPELFQDMALVKPAGGREKPWHQDHAYFNVPIDTPIVGVWIPMGTVTPENGCMHFVAGGHRAGPRPHFKRRDWQICDTAVEVEGRVAVPMAAGDVLFFDGKVPHGTPINQTEEFRWAVQFHYRPAATPLADDSVRLAAFGSEGKDVTC
jgi:phytanoyl-CoA hydroxylase